MTSTDVSMKRHDLVMFGGSIQHILPSSAAEESLINYPIFKTLQFPVL